jgi:signal transduction histidine kinase/CheY-like chemotaxis protein
MEDQLLGVIELAALRPFSQVHRDFLDQVTEALGVNVSSLVANARTDELLTESQRLTAELRSQQQEMRRSNAELQEQAALLADRNSDIESKNREIEQARQELEQRAQQLSTASMYKSEFLANMSHELRTPLNSLLVLAQLLAQNPGGNLTEKQVGYATVIHSAGSDLLELINDILDLSKVEAGKLDVSPAPFALRPLLDSLETIFRPLTADKALEFRVSTGPDLPADLVSDEQRLRQILRNLLSNAVKFTETGGVELRVELVASSARPRELRGHEQVLAFRVEDTGIGIAAEHLNTIFGAFQQADGTTSRRYGGTGLGLSISRQIAHLLGGVIEADSTVGRGSRFSLLLPVTPSGGTEALAHVAPVRSAPPQAALGSELDGRVVLVVDDDERNVFALVGVLELHGAEVLRAADGQEGLDVLQSREDIDVVLMDVMMPELDGYEATRRIRSVPHFADLPIIAVTAKAMPGDREEILAAGATDYVVKPLDADDLVARIRRHLR